MLSIAATTAGRKAVGVMSDSADVSDSADDAVDSRHDDDKDNCDMVLTPPMVPPVGIRCG